MTPTEMERMLRATLDDWQLSRSERKALQSVLVEASWSDSDMARARALAFDLAREHLLREGDRALLQWLEGVVKLLLPREGDESIAKAFFSPGSACQDALRQRIASALNRIDVCVFTITDDKLSTALLDAHRRGVKVRIITDDEKADDFGSDALALSRAGVPVKVDQSEHHMHHKFIIFDDEVLGTGSYNFTRSTARHNQENLIISNNGRLLSAFHRTFERLWQESTKL